MKFKKYFLLALMIFSVPAFAQETAYKTIQNIAYYPENSEGATEYQNKQCRLDVYYPEGKKDVPVIVWFHGGGLTGGGKELPQALKDKGYCVVGVGGVCYPSISSEVGMSISSWIDLEPVVISLFRNGLTKIFAQFFVHF